MSYGCKIHESLPYPYLTEQKFIGEAVLKGYAMYQVRSYPGVIPDNSDSILGELYEIDERTLKRLDRLEGEGYLYKRTSEKVTVDKTEYDAYVYIWLGNIEDRPKISFENMPWRAYKVRCI